MQTERIHQKYLNDRENKESDIYTELEYDYIRSIFNGARFVLLMATNPQAVVRIYAFIILLSNI